MNKFHYGNRPTGCVLVLVCLFFWESLKKNRWSFQKSLRLCMWGKSVECMHSSTKQISCKLATSGPRLSVPSDIGRTICAAISISLQAYKMWRRVHKSCKRPKGKRRFYQIVRAASLCSSMINIQLSNHQDCNKHYSPSPHLIINTILILWCISMFLI